MENVVMKLQVNKLSYLLKICLILNMS